MTGYGRAEKTIDGREITVEMRAVNNRYLDLNVKLPRVYGFAEDAVKSLIKANVNRGKLDLFITVNVTADTSLQISLNKPVLEGYLAALKSIAADYGVRDDISVTALSRMPDVFVVEKQEEDEQKLTDDILSVVKEALAKFNAMREKEGAAMEADLRSRAKTVLSLVEKVEARSPVTLAEYRARLTEKMQEVLGQTNIDEGRILQEAAIYADKIAVDEETVRLRSHLDQLEQMLTSGGPIGRKLDFLLQEFNRESNTIGSKAQGGAGKDPRADAEHRVSGGSYETDLDRLRQRRRGGADFGCRQPGLGPHQARRAGGARARDAARRVVRPQDEIRSADGYGSCHPLVRHAGDHCRAHGRKECRGDERTAMKGKLFAVSGPSGVGKNTVLNSVVQQRDRVQYSISATSRPMRPGEVDGKSYYFVTRAQFETMIENGELLEHAEYVGNYYGTPLAPIREALEAGTDVVMDVDVVGALNIKKRLPEAVLVFLTAPSLAEIRRRLEKRGDVSPEAMEKRMERAKWEYSQAYQYDYLVVNDTVGHAAAELLAIMTAEKCKMMDRIHCIKEEL